MTNFDAWNASMSSALASHLWQSTVFAASAWLLALALRNYPARVRFAVWMFASVKFLVPFALLINLGGHWVRPTLHPQVRVAFYTMIEKLGRPFAERHAVSTGSILSDHSAHVSSAVFVLLTTLWLCGCLVMLVRSTVHWVNAHRVIVDATPVHEGREVCALRRAEAKGRPRKPIPMVVTPRAIEPGVFGVFRPVLVWPAGLSEQLDDLQIQAIAAHELEHVRRRDNLMFAAHALVEALFWFHPAVHWLGSRMREERERACDERVIEQSAEPEKYAESILKVCAFCLEPPLPFVAGVSGPDLRRRILRIMSRRSGVALTFGRRSVLATAAVLVLTMPIGFGILRGQVGSISKPVPADSAVAKELPKFDVASVKPASSVDGMTGLLDFPDGISIKGTPARMLLLFAFDVADDRIVGVPSWIASNRYDIEAKVKPEDAPMLSKLTPEERHAMLIPVLVERFNLRFHHETRVLPMYALVVAKGGPRLAESKVDGKTMMMPGRVEAKGATIDTLRRSLSTLLGRSVVDKTGLTSNYDYTLQWATDNARLPMTGDEGGAPHSDAGNDSSSVSVFTAIQEQLGLKLESQKGDVDVIVIDHIDQPSVN